MAANTATVKINIKVNDDDTVKVLDSVGSASKKAGDTGSKSFNKMNSSAKSMTSTLVKMGAAVGGLYAVKKALDFSMETIALASDLEETQGKFDVVFRGMTASAEAWSDRLGAAYAMSETESKKYLSNIQDLLVPTGMLREDAGKLSNEFVKLAADFGSFNNRETSAVIMDIQSALQGSSETMAKYGVNVKAAKVEQEILNQGWVTSKKDITDAHKAQAIYNIMMRDGADAVGDMERTSDSYANQLKKAHANADDLQTKLGEHLLPAANNVVSAFNDWVEANDGLINQKIDAYADGIHTSLVSIKETYDAIPSEVIGGAGIIGSMLFGKKVAGFVAAAMLIPKLANTVSGFQAAFDGKLDWAEFAAMNATELAAALAEIRKESSELDQINDPWERLAYLAGQSKTGVDETAEATETLIKTFEPMPDLMKKTGDEAEKVVKIIGTKAGLLEKWVNADPDDVVEPFEAVSESLFDLEELNKEVTRNIFQEWSGLLTDAITLEMSGLDSYLSGAGQALGSTFSSHFMAEVMGNEGGLIAGLTSALSDPSLMGLGFLSAGLSFAGGLFGDDAPSYFDVLSGKIDDLIAQLAENTQALKDELFGISEFTTIIRNAKTSVLNDDLAGMGSLTDELNLPGGMKKRDTPWYQSGAMAWAGSALDFVPGVGYLAGEMLKKDKGYTAYDMDAGQLSDTMSVLFDSLNLAELFDLFKQSSTDAGALMDMLADKNLLNPELPQRVIDWFSDEKGAQNIEKVSEGISAVLEEAVLEVLTTAQTLADNITGYVENHDDAQLTDYAGTMKAMETSIADFQDQAKNAIPILKTMIASENISIENKQKAVEQLDLLNAAEADYARILAETETRYKEARQATMTAMAADISAYTDPKSSLENTIASVVDKGEKYRDELIDNGMALDLATAKTSAWTTVMSELVKQEMVNNTTRSLSIQLLTAQGDTEGALAMQRQGEINDLRDTFGDFSGPLEAIKQKIWDIEDAARALSAVDVARTAYQSAVSSALSTAQAGQDALQSDYDTAKTDYVNALNEKISAENAASAARANAMSSAASEYGRLASEAESLADSFATLKDSIADYRANLLSDSSTVGVETAYQNAQRQFNSAVSGMYASDPDTVQQSLSDITSMADALLSSSKNMGSLDAYNADLARVLTVLNTAESIAGVGETNAEKEMKSALARQASMESAASSLSSHTSKWQSMLDAIDADTADTRTFEEKQTDFFTAESALDNSSFAAEIDYWQQELDRLDLLIDGNASLETAFGNYATTLTSAIAGGYDDISGRFAAELAALETTPAAITAQASFAGGGTISGPSSGYNVVTEFHGTERIRTEQQEDQLAGLLSDVREVLIEIRNTNGDQNLNAIKHLKEFKKVVYGSNALNIQEAS